MSLALKVVKNAERRFTACKVINSANRCNFKFGSPYHHSSVRPFDASLVSHSFYKCSPRQNWTDLHEFVAAARTHLNMHPHMCRRGGNHLCSHRVLMVCEKKPTGDGRMLFPSPFPSLLESTLAPSMRFESDKLMIVFPELYMALLSLSPARFDKFDYRAGVGEGRVGMLDGENGRASEREARKNIISTQHGGSHSTRSVCRLYPPTDIMCGLFNRSSRLLWGGCVQ